ncbi:MAG: hypothetical protein U0840_02675 [Gemmataceae bacterium]
MSEGRSEAEKWVATVAALAVDALVDAGLVSAERFEDARVVVAEELLVRLCVGDYPPPVDNVAGGSARKD